MIIEREIGPHVVGAEASVRDFLRKSLDQDVRLMLVVEEDGRLVGVISSGDIRRWLVSGPTVDLEAPVSEASNPNFLWARASESPDRLRARFTEKIDEIPLLDERGRLVAIALSRSVAIRIDGRLIDERSPAFLIAEIGINHNGDVALAKRLVEHAADAGADCAKFQMRDMDTLYQNAGDPDSIDEDIGSQYTLDLLSRFNLSNDELFACFDHTRDLGLIPLCTPWDRVSVAALESYGMPAYKVASADMTNHDLLEALVATGKPLIMSTGMSREDEIAQSVRFLQDRGARYVLLHCNSTYPTPFKDVNLAYLPRLREIGDCLVGYSGHERGFAIPLAAASLGAKVIEKHLTVDRTMEGSDHRVSLLPDEFAAMVQGVRAVEAAMGASGERVPSQGELINRDTLAKSVVAAHDIAAGEVISAESLSVKSPGKGLQPNRMVELIGRPAVRAVPAGGFFFPSDLADSRAAARSFTFRRPWGLPVRFHDASTLGAMSDPDFLEFHLSFKDLNEDPAQFFPERSAAFHVVHSPDLFAGDHLLNLASDDDAYRDRSLAELQRVVDMTRRLSEHFTTPGRPMIVASLGGFTRTAPLPVSARRTLYDRIAEGLERIDSAGVEILPQTLPPFPWYFGGQLFCNAFVDAEDTAAFCERTGLRLCVDISHSKLAANHARRPFSEFVELLAPHAAHLHIVDAAGVDGEGLQVGEGEIDFATLAAQLERLCPDAPFIPEIWQGHKNAGEGFWIALDRLERWF